MCLHKYIRKSRNEKALIIYSNWDTFPQLYHNGNLIGGADVIAELQKKNELKNILK
ncbi:MAG: hypothetical protein Q8O27_01230 [Enterobacteriaceae bacterium]|nr:hypothetical protein [Enterobacteriaceae bacterium]